MIVFRLALSRPIWQRWALAGQSRGYAGSYGSNRPFHVFAAARTNENNINLFCVQGRLPKYNPPRPLLRIDRRSRSLTTADVDSKSSQRPAFARNGTLIFSNARRGQSFAISAVAAAQGAFWLTATYMSMTSVEPLILPIWTVGGAGLSVLFVGMVNMYLKRLVASLSVEQGDGSLLRVVTHSFWGALRAPVEIETRYIVGGPKKDAKEERYWTFGVQPESASTVFYYIVDMKYGVLDQEAVSAICSSPRGGSLLLILAHRRQAEEMRARWQEWQRSKDSAKRKE